MKGVKRSTNSFNGVVIVKQAMRPKKDWVESHERLLVEMEKNVGRMVGEDGEPRLEAMVEAER
jgi:hypothetical protein